MVECGNDELKRIPDDEARRRISEIITDEKLTLARIYSLDGKSRLQYEGRVPKDEQFTANFIDKTFAKTRKADFSKIFQTHYPNLLNQLKEEDPSSQAAAKELLAKHISSLPDRAFNLGYLDLPTGIPASITRLLPHPIYIPAVKDPKDELAAKQGTPLKEILGFLLEVIEPKLVEEQKVFAKLHDKLNVQSQEGAEKDGRLEELKSVENALEENLREHFPKASLSIQFPPPSIQDILANSDIEIDDGAIKGSIDTKGDGLKRAVIFSIFRTYVDMAIKKPWETEENETTTPARRYLFLFEEPELYLHPSAQKVLFSALAGMSEHHQVIVSTHSPLFLSAESTTTFIKLMKQDSVDSKPPFSTAFPINLTSDLSARDAFQLTCFENNNAALFSRRVVLVEGDSDLIAFRHIAKELDPSWSFDRGPAAIIRVGGKGSFARYREFLSRFSIETYVIGDLDLLVKDLDKTGISHDAQVWEMHRNLLDKIQAALPQEALDGNGKTITRKYKLGDFVELVKAVQAGHPISDDDVKLAESMIDEAAADARLKLMREDENLKELMLELLAELRDHNVFVLSKGDIEDYYPADISGEKVERAQKFCEHYKGKDRILACSPIVPLSDDKAEPEFLAIFQRIFND